MPTSPARIIDTVTAVYYWDHISYLYDIIRAQPSVCPPSSPRGVHTNGTSESPFHLCFAVFVIYFTFLSILRPRIIREARRAAVKDNSQLPLAAYLEDRNIFNPPSTDLRDAFRELSRTHSTEAIVAVLALRCIAFYYITTTAQCSELGLEVWARLSSYALCLSHMLTASNRLSGYCTCISWS